MLRVWMEEMRTPSSLTLRRYRHPIGRPGFQPHGLPSPLSEAASILHRLENGPSLHVGCPMWLVERLAILLTRLLRS